MVLCEGGERGARSIVDADPVTSLVPSQDLHLLANLANLSVQYSIRTSRFQIAQHRQINRTSEIGFWRRPTPERFYTTQDCPTAMATGAILRPSRQLAGRLLTHGQPFACRGRFSSKTGSLPTVPACPEPSCGCAAMPPMPKGLPIDRESPLKGVMPAYAEQVLICTGQDDWSSRIEDENSGDNLAADLKELFGRGGYYSDVSRETKKPPRA